MGGREGKDNKSVKAVEILSFIPQLHVWKAMLGAWEDKIKLAQVHLVHCNLGFLSLKWRLL